MFAKSRSEQYDDLSQVHQEMLDLLYGDKEEFVAAIETSRLGDYIIAVDKIPGDSDRIYGLLDRLGFTAYETDGYEYTADELFIDIVSEYIQDVDLLRHQDTKFQSNLPTTDELINMTKPEFAELMMKLNAEYTDEKYNTRLTWLQTSYKGGVYF